MLQVAPMALGFFIVAAFVAGFITCIYVNVLWLSDRSNNESSNTDS